MLRTLVAHHASYLAPSLLLVSSLLAQGEFVDFETPQTKPLAIATVAGHDYLLACNTPDNSVEIYDTHNNQFVTRVPVGLRPGTVFFSAAQMSFYTANHLGDSITKVSLSMQSGQLHASLDRTVEIGDEPTDIAMFPDGRFLMVAMSSTGAYAMIDALTLEAPGGNRALLEVISAIPIGSLNAPEAMKSPRRLLIENGQFFAMNAQGGNSAAYDYDAFSLDFLTLQQKKFTGLGTNNANMVLGKNGTLYVVGGLARNDLISEATVALAPTGFVESHVWIIDNAAASTVTVKDRDLNLNSIGNAVPKYRSIAQPTDVALLEAGNDVRKIFITSFGTDRIAALHVQPGVAATDWPMTTIDVTPHNPLAYDVVGPRGLVMKYGSVGVTGDPGTRLYVLNRLDNSISVIEPHSEQVVARVGLQNDPRPEAVIFGHEALYSAKLSGNGYTSCASCHIDARTDGIAWDLSGTGTSAIAPELIDGMTLAEPVPVVFAGVKGMLVTQSLLGMMTSPVNPEAQQFFSTEPLHWRGDKLDFTDFNSAYVGLMGAPNIGTSLDPIGIAKQEMINFKNMIVRAVEPPNPYQLPNRTYSGSLGTPGQEDGSGALRGLKLFHERGRPGDTNAGRSCVQCHSLPDGSNNLLTTAVGGPVPGSILPLETAELRRLRVREGSLEFMAPSLSITKTSEFGLSHAGKFNVKIGGLLFTDVAPSINWFVFNGANPPGQPPQYLNIWKVVDLIDFVRQLDSGIAPMVGKSLTVEAATAASVGTTFWVGLAENQVAVSNSGLAAFYQDTTGRRSFYFDQTQNPAQYVEDGTATKFSRAALLALLQNPADRLIFQATPVGSGRRVASAAGSAGPITGAAPTKIELQPMVPTAAWSEIPKLSKNWKLGTTPVTSPDDFNWDGKTLSGQAVPEPDSLKTLRIFQQALLDPQVPGGFGLTGMRHEAPRRFRVSGQDIRAGAKLQIRIALGSAPPHANLTNTKLIEVPIFPTSKYTLGGEQIWESAVEADNLLIYQLMLGGMSAPGVADALHGLLPEPSNAAFQAVTWNKYHVTVENSDGTSGSGASWQPITIQ